MSTMIIPFFIIGADAVQDFRKKEIFFFLTVGAAFAGAVYTLITGGMSGGPGCSQSPGENLAGLLLALVPGAVVLAGSILSGNQIGRGDAIALFAIGAWTDMWFAWEVLLYGTLGAAAFSILFWAIRRKNAEIPFVPFLFAAMAAVCFL